MKQKDEERERERVGERERGREGLRGEAGVQLSAAFAGLSAAFAGFSAAFAGLSAAGGVRRRQAHRWLSGGSVMRQRLQRRTRGW